ncbi:DUF6325 family protein [Gordonia sp. NPDC003425]
MDDSSVDSDVDTDVEMGPIDYLLVEFPADHEPDGSALSLLLDLVDAGTIRVLDLAMIRREPDGSAVGVDFADVDFTGDIDTGFLAEASSGLLDETDLAEAASALEPGCLGVLVVYENLWAAPLATGLRRSGAQLVASGRIPVNALIAALDAVEEAAED